MNSLQIDRVVRAPPISDGDEDMLLGQVLQIARGRGFRRAGDGHVFLGTHATLETVRAFLQHTT
jgi:hypothetical protein